MNLDTQMAHLHNETDAERVARLRGLYAGAMERDQELTLKVAEAQAQYRTSLVNSASPSILRGRSKVVRSLVASRAKVRFERKQLELELELAEATLWEE
jgi:hypothetical protein